MKEAQEYIKEANKYYKSKGYDSDFFKSRDEDRDGDVYECIDEQAIEGAIKQAYIDGIKYRELETEQAASELFLTWITNRDVLDTAIGYESARYIIDIKGNRFVPLELVQKLANKLAEGAYLAAYETAKSRLL